MTAAGEEAEENLPEAVQVYVSGGKAALV